MMGCLIPFCVMAKSNISMGHYYIDDDSQSYQFTSLSIKKKESSWAAKISLPYVQTQKGEAGLGNIIFKASQKWRYERLLFRAHVKHKIATAQKEIVTPVNDTALAIEVNHQFSWGVGFIESGYWWRQAKSYKRKDTAYASAGIIKGFKPYAAGLIVDHKPTALGEQDSMVSILIKRTILKKYAVTALIGKGLTNDSPNTMVGLQFSKKITDW